MTNNKETQGHRKMVQHYKDLFNNQVFLSELEKIKNIKNPKKRNKAYWKLAYKYDIDYDSGSPLMAHLFNLDKYLDGSQELDICRIYDMPDEFLNPLFPVDFDIPPSKHPQKRKDFTAYPIHLGISPKASKRDVLDFIQNRWDDIHYYLEMYGAQALRVRKRTKNERDMYIWQNKDKPSQQIEDLVNQKYPDENITYSDINKILHRLKKRFNHL